VNDCYLTTEYVPREPGGPEGKRVATRGTPDGKDGDITEIQDKGPDTNLLFESPVRAWAGGDG
jgi:hypothetical protein